MAEERMLNDEILLGLIKANSGGGGGGTSNYNLLDNLPQINGNTLTGNKSASDLDLVGAVDGKGLSTNDYTNADKAIVDGVTAALEGKQDALTAGNYISIANDGTINVTQGIGVYDVYSYEIKSINSGYATKITKRKNGVFESEQDISNGAYSSDNRLNVDDRFEFWYTFAGYLWHYKLLVDSNEHQKDEEVSWTYSTLVDYTETFNVSQDSSTDLATKGDVNTAIAGKQDILTFDDTPTDNSNNPVKSNGIYDALALKQDATDNSLDTDAKTIVGAINEHEGDIDSLKSGLTNLDNEVNGDATVYPYADVITIEDAVPANLAECNVKIDPVQDLHGYDKPWVGGASKNSFVSAVAKTEALNGITISTNGDGIYAIKGTASAQTNIDFPLKQGFVIPSSETHKFCLKNTFSNDKVTLFLYNGGTQIDNWGCYPVDRIADSWSTMTGNTINKVQIRVQEGAVIDGTVAPMFLLKTETDTSYAPWDNICPITGHTEASVQRDGKNLIPLIEANAYNSDGTTFTTANRCRTPIIKVTSGTYALQAASAVTGKTLQTRYALWKNNSYTENELLSESEWVNNASYSFTLAEDTYISVAFRYSDNASISASNLHAQLELGSSATDYEPYQGKTYTIALGSTIYGGTVNFKTGVMTVDRAVIEYDGSNDENWLLDEGTHNFFYIELTGRDATKAVIANNCVNASISKTTTDLGVGTDARYLRYRYANDNSLTVSDLKTFLASNNLQICYYIATPTTIQLTPQQIQLLQGTNTLTASTGQISVTVNGVSGAIGVVQTQANNTDEALAELAEQLPTAPTTDGAYVLTVTVADGTPTYSWESAS